MRLVAPLLLVTFLVTSTPSEAQILEIQPVDFLLRGTIESDGAPLERARLIVSRTDDGTVLVDRVFTGADGEYVTAFQAEALVELGLGDPGEGEVEPQAGTRLWMGPAWPNPLRANGDLHLTLPYSAPAEAGGPPTLDVFDVRGRRVEPGQTLASGVYLYRLRWGMRRTLARKLLVIGRGELRVDLTAVDPRTAPTGGSEPRPTAKRGEGIVEVEVRVEKAGWVAQQRTLALDSLLENEASFSLAAEAVPTAVASVGGTLEAGAVALLDGSASTGPGSLTYAWSFGDGQHGGGQTVAHVYAMPGSYEAELTVAGPHGATATTSVTVDVQPGAPPASAAATVVGSITDAVGNLLEGVEVRWVETGAAAMSLGDGSVTFEDMPTGVPVVFELTKPGFTLQTVRLVLPPQSEFATFEASLRRRRAPVSLTRVEDGGLAESEDGACVDLPPDALMRADGSAAAGAASVCITPIDVSDRNEVTAFPGSFEGLNGDGDQGLLLTYGVMEVVFEQDGEELQLAPGRTADLDIPLYAANASVGQTIDLWSADPSTGLWRQEGSGTVVASEGSPTGLVLRASVTHFSWWNCDRFEGNPRRPRPRCKLRDGGGQPVLDLPAGESCTIDTEILGEGGPFSGPSGNIPPEGQEVLVPAGVDVRIEGAAFNGTVRGEVVLEAGDPDGEIVVVLDPVVLADAHVDPPVLVDASIDPAGEIDVYFFQAMAEGQVVSVLANPSTGSSLEGTATLIDPLGNTLFAEAFDGDTFAVLQELPMRGEYAIEIDGTAHEPGGYELDVRFVETLDMAIPSRAIAQTERGLVQRYALEASAGAWYSLDFRKLDGEGYYGHLTVEDPQGAVIYSRDIYNVSFSSTPLRIATSGRHVITVASDDMRGHYEFAVRDVPEIKPGAVVESAGENRSTRFWRFEAQAGDLVRSTLDGFNAQTGISDVDYDALDVVFPPPIFGDGSSIYRVETAGTYFVWVSSSTSSDLLTSWPFRLALNDVRAPRPIEFTAHGRAALTSRLDHFGDVRLFSFDATAGAGLEIRMQKVEGSSVGSSGRFRLFQVGTGTVVQPQLPVNPFDSNALYSGDDASGILENAYYRLPDDDTYVFMVAAATPETGPFDLIVDRAAASADITVDDDLAQDPDADTRSLHAALMAATSGGTVSVRDGQYVAPRTFWPAEVVTLQGAGPETVLRSATLNTVLRSSKGFHALRDLTLLAELGGSHKPAVIGSPQSMIVERITTTPGEGAGATNIALEIDNGAGVIVRDCTFENAGRALRIDGCDDVTIENNEFLASAGQVEVLQSSATQILANHWNADSDGTAIDVWNSVGTLIAGNDILMATSQSGGGSLDFAIVVIDRDDSGDQPATVLRDNRIDTDEAGIQARVFGAGSRIEIERNFVDVSSEASRMGLDVYCGSNAPDQTLLVRNNVFEETTSFGGIYLRDANQFASIEIVNNTLRVSPTSSNQPSHWAVGISTTTTVNGPLPILMANNVFVGIGGVGIDIPVGATIDGDYNLFWNFVQTYNDGTTSTGTHDLTGDPQFIDDELRVSADSPAVDSGATVVEVSSVPPDDFSSQARPQGMGVDRGAHER